MKSVFAILTAAAVWAFTALAPAEAAPVQATGTPNTYVTPGGAVASAGVQNVVGVDSSTGLPCLIGSTATCATKSIDQGASSNNAPFQGAVALTVGTPDTTSRRSIGANCTSPGSAVIQFGDSSTVTVALGQGWQTFPFAANEVVSTAGGAACTFYNLK